MIYAGRTRRRLKLDKNEDLIKKDWGCKSVLIRILCLVEPGGSSTKGNQKVAEKWRGSF